MFNSIARQLAVAGFLVAGFSGAHAATQYTFRTAVVGMMPTAAAPAAPVAPPVSDQIKYSGIRGSFTAPKPAPTFSTSQGAPAAARITCSINLSASETVALLVGGRGVGGGGGYTGGADGAPGSSYHAPGSLIQHYPGFNSTADGSITITY